MANVVKTTFIGDPEPQLRTTSQLRKDIERYQREQERREKEITRTFEREAKQRQQQEQKTLREAEREYDRMVRERERQEKAITRATLQEIRLREQAQREAEADARFRAQELETFRQGILSRQPVAPGGNIFSRLSTQQRANLSFQANDVISGLAMGQSPFQILAQQGGQIVQIFQQTEAAQKGVATATTAAATAQAAFAANSRQAAVEIAKSHQSATLLGASITSLSVLGVAGLVTIGAVYRLMQDIEAAAKARLDTEIAITGELNKQRLAQIEFQKERQKEQEGRDLNRFLGSAGTFFVSQARAAREKELASLLQEVDRETQIRGAALSASGGIKSKEFRDQFLNRGLEDQKRRIDQLREELKTLDKEIDERATDRAKGFAGPSVLIRGALERAAAVRSLIEAQAVAEAKAREERDKKEKKRLEDYKKKLEEIAKARVEAFQISLSTREGNPFLDQLENTERRMQSMLQTTKDLGSAIRDALAGQILNQSERQRQGLRIDAELDALGFREQARDFRRGFRTGDEAEILRRAQRRLYPNYFTQEGRESHLQREIQVHREIVNRERAADLDRRLRILDPKNEIANAKLVQFAQGLDPATLNYQQRQQIAGAFEREADRKLNAEKAAVDFYTKMLGFFNPGAGGMPVSIKNGKHVVEIRNKAKDRAEVTESPSQQQTNDFYNPN